MTTAIFRLVHYFNSARKSMLQSPALPIPNDCHMICQDVCSFWVPCHLFQGGGPLCFKHLCSSSQNMTSRGARQLPFGNQTWLDRKIPVLWRLIAGKIHAPRWIFPARDVFFVPQSKRSPGPVPTRRITVGTPIFCPSLGVFIPSGNCETAWLIELDDLPHLTS